MLEHVYMYQPFIHIGRPQYKQAGADVLALMASAEQTGKIAT